MKRYAGKELFHLADDGSMSLLAWQQYDSAKDAPVMVLAADYDRDTQALRADADRLERENHSLRYCMSVTKTGEERINYYLQQMEQMRADNVADHQRRVDQILALQAELAAVRADCAQFCGENERFRKALEAIEARWTQARRHHDCGDYERGYGQAEADIGQFARAALHSSPAGKEKL